MPRLRRFLRRLAILCLFGFVAYGVAGALIAQLPGVEVPADMPRIWPDFLPAWPFVAVLVVGGLAVAADIVVWVVLEARARSERERLEKLAEQWPQRADAKAAAAGGTPALRVGRFRAQGLPAAVRLDWTSPAGSFDRILIYRSNQGFALSPAGGTGQAVAYEGEEDGCLDGPLVANRVYFYTLFALGRGAGGEASSPVWAWAVTLRPGKSA